MSNGEDNVLDNWEEIDLDSGFNNQLDQIRKDIQADESRKQQQQEQQQTDPMAFQNSIPLMMVMRPEEEYSSGNYSAKPAVKILRRPTQQNEALGNDNRPKQPIKTLKQREQEYAEARLRIFGSAKNPEDELEAALEQKLSTKLQDFPNSSTNDITPILTTPTLTTTSEETARNNNIRAQLTMISNPNLNGQINYQIKNDNIIRSPRGPDGSSGFKIRR